PRREELHRPLVGKAADLCAIVIPAQEPRESWFVLQNSKGQQYEIHDFVQRVTMAVKNLLKWSRASGPAGPDRSPGTSCSKYRRLTYVEPVVPRCQRSAPFGLRLRRGWRSARSGRRRPGRSQARTPHSRAASELADPAHRHGFESTAGS